MHHRVWSAPIPGPAAGSDWEWVPATGQVTRLLTLLGTLTTSATAANRVPVLQLKDQDGTVVWETAAVTAQAASLGWAYSASSTGGAAESGAAETAGVVSLTLPDMWAPAGWSWGTATQGLQTGDTWTGLIAVLEPGLDAYDVDRREAAIRQALKALEAGG